jgi:hypothetical protein
LRVFVQTKTDQILLAKPVGGGNDNSAIFQKGPMQKLSATAPLIHPECVISNSDFGAYCEVGLGSRMTNSTFLDYAYCDRFADTANATVGKFVNIAAMARIGPSDHPMGNAGLHPFLYRSSYYWDDAEDDTEFFQHRAVPPSTLIHGSAMAQSSSPRSQSARGPSLQAVLSSPKTWPPI